MSKIYPVGLYYDNPREGAPEFVLGRMSIKREEFIKWLEMQTPNDKGYINFDVLQGRENKPYVCLNVYKKIQN
jgi:hypothetical protein